MSEFPFTQALRAAAERAARIESLLIVLRARFGVMTSTVAAGLNEVTEHDKLERLTPEAVLCTSLQEFEEALRQELSVPSPPLDALQVEATEIIEQLKSMRQS